VSDLRVSVMAQVYFNWSKTHFGALFRIRFQKCLLAPPTILDFFQHIPQKQKWMLPLSSTLFQLKYHPPSSPTKSISESLMTNLSSLLNSHLRNAPQYPMTYNG